MNGAESIKQFVEYLSSGGISIIDLTAPLGPDTPVLKLPPELAVDTPQVEIHSISHYDKNGPFWAWNWLKLGEHSGTHFDAPQHWITGSGFANGTTDTIPVANFVAPANVIDCSEAATRDADFLLNADGVKAWEARHGAIRAGEWVLMRTDWDKRNSSVDRFLNADEHGPHSPGPTVDCIEYILERGAIGWGTQCIGTDAGAAGGMNPPFPAHNLMHKANRYGLASLVNLDKLPPKGAILIAAPLKIVKGTGSPVRALALVANS